MTGTPQHTTPPAAGWSGRPIRVLVAEDQSAVRDGLVLILQTCPDIEVVGQAVDGEQAVQLAWDLRPDLVLMDIQMPKLDGVSATRLVAQGMNIGVLVLTTFDLDEYVFGALSAGASGFLLKNTDAQSLIAAVRTVARGEGLIAPSVTRRFIAEFASRAPQSQHGDVASLTASPQREKDERRRTVLDLLSLREREVLACIGEGLTNAEIAARLGTAESTVKTQVSRLMGKLQVRNRAQAAVLAAELAG
ncbi:DNA-binding response regulator [Streptomyces spiroverticillatus]|uniref:DNA-binding response regulator n=1 Tax=Streptomyces finlayi TaxID=67296 RepID=A0A918X4Y3_9ACTN|nr:response regulator transcription factor [Streptomyces finlayi]GHA36193.1 DNA-binding response regulator [Streptomyces spiroverticillatus]GHD12386.1 DNA-binding response regulator [Streptomyces finlayi]